MAKLQNMGTTNNHFAIYNVLQFTKLDWVYIWPASFNFTVAFLPNKACESLSSVLNFIKLIKNLIDSIT